MENTHVTKLRQVAELLGGTLQEAETGWSNEGRVEIALQDSVTFTVIWGRGMAKVGMYAVWPTWPGGSDKRRRIPSDVLPYERRDERYDINTSSAKAAEQLAGDIKRRFLPRYLDMYAQLVARVKADDDYERGRKAMVAKIVEAVPGASRRDDRVWLPSPFRLGTVYADSLTVELCGITIEQFRAVVAVIDRGGLT